MINICKSHLTVTVCDLALNGKKGILEENKYSPTTRTSEKVQPFLFTACPHTFLLSNYRVFSHTSTSEVLHQSLLISSSELSQQSLLTLCSPSFGEIVLLLTSIYETEMLEKSLLTVPPCFILRHSPSSRSELQQLFLLTSCSHSISHTSLPSHIRSADFFSYILLCVENHFSEVEDMGKCHKQQRVSDDGTDTDSLEQTLNNGYVESGLYTLLSWYSWTYQW